MRELITDDIPDTVKAALRGHRHRKSNEVSLNRKKSALNRPTNFTSRTGNALRIAARIVTQHGEDYLPIFRRIEKELEDENAKHDDIERARRVAGAE
ncbi:hypothetical protein [Cerasicoccus frondis]|uniref:hypothetical protein n=1 Tax=Cerasicoccus frondis TaxID=490090 RepID=UPI002852C7E0|nr:hypothetical protein [Cerasicoccus frondis]